MKTIGEQLLQLTVKELSDVTSNIESSLAGIGDIANAVAAADKQASTGNAPGSTKEEKPAIEPENTATTTGTISTKDKNVQPGKQIGKRDILNALESAKLSTNDKTVRNTVRALIKAGLIKTS